jgi:hypothetical protein
VPFAFKSSPPGFKRGYEKISSVFLEFFLYGRFPPLRSGPGFSGFRCSLQTQPAIISRNYKKITGTQKIFCKKQKINRLPAVFALRAALQSLPRGAKIILPSPITTMRRNMLCPELNKTAAICTSHAVNKFVTTPANCKPHFINFLSAKISTRF